MSVKPATVVAYVGTPTLGDFIMQQLVAASVTRSLPGSRLAVVYRDDRPYKGFVTWMNPWVSHARPVPASAEWVIPIDWVAGAAAPTATAEDLAWREAGFHDPDVFLTPRLLAFEHCIGRPPALRIPVEAQGPLDADLQRRGLDPARWFACLHLREGCYRYRGPADRDVDPQSYVPALDRIIDGLGGQVVRLGDPGMTPLPARPGLIDFTDAPFPAQAAALARARFFLGSDSGPTQLACALRTPAATTNALNITVWNDGDIALMRRLRRPEGGHYPLADMLAAGCMTLHTTRPPPHDYEPNRPEQILTVVDRLYAATGDCPGWRPAPPEEREYLPAPVVMPPAVRETVEMANLRVED